MSALQPGSETGRTAAISTDSLGASDDPRVASVLAANATRPSSSTTCSADKAKAAALSPGPKALGRWLVGVVCKRSRERPLLTRREAPAEAMVSVVPVAKPATSCPSSLAGAAALPVSSIFAERRVLSV